MARSGSECLADTPTIARRPAKAHSASPRLVDTDRKQRNGVPMKTNQRLYLELPVFVYRLSTDKEPEPLREAARSAVVYAGGCVLTLGATVELGQELLLVNPKTKVRAACRVTGFEPQKNGSQPMVRLEFSQLVPRFWGVMFPPEQGDPAERKLPQLPVPMRRVDTTAQPSKHPASERKDARITQNISRRGLTVKPTTPRIPSKWELLITGIAHGLEVVPSHLSRALRDTGITIVRWPVPHFGRIRQSTAKQAHALVCLGTILADLCKTRIKAWRKITAGLVRCACLASAAAATSLGKSAGIQFVKLSCAAKGHLEKCLCNLEFVRVKSFELCPFVSRPQAWLREIAKHLLLVVA